ncbi:hypothetical protein [Streptomyces sp. TN58]|uniref:hypothetical protein n=1 Tax=Streptomyces sp. TN58 TaxID=234612 RepID=UPI00133132FA|nr:hypothetical protein [Streptomyces sp. TN58]
MKKKSIVQLGAVALTVLSVGVGTPAVAASPTGTAPAVASGAKPGPQDASCNMWKTGGPPWGGAAYCSGMAWADTFQVKLTCINHRGQTFTVLGPKRHTNETSSATCSSDPNVGVLTVGTVQSA